MKTAEQIEVYKFSMILGAPQLDTAWKKFQRRRTFNVLLGWFLVGMSIGTGMVFVGWLWTLAR